MQIYNADNQYIDWETINICFDVHRNKCFLNSGYPYFFYIGIKYFGKCNYMKCYDR